MAPIAMMTLTGAVNWLYAGPKTTKIMKERKHQGMVDLNGCSLNTLEYSQRSADDCNRNEGRKEELRQWTALSRDAEAQ